MRIGLAQIRPVKGDLSCNIQKHRQLIELGVEEAAEFILFPELSLTGYEPTLAETLALALSDTRLDTFQQLADRHEISIGVGAPIRHGATHQIGSVLFISLVLFQPHQARKLYAKHYLFPDEVPYFSAGENYFGSIHGNDEIALAICYEISEPKHVDAASQRGAKIYAASVAKFEEGIQRAEQRMAAIAQQHSMMTMMANSIGHADGALCAGRSAAWNSDGVCVAQLDSAREGILLVDTISDRAKTRYLLETSER